MNATRLPLHDVRVIEVAGYASAPFATMMLADLGADVVKVEPPKGDPFRRFARPRAAMSPVFANVNRGKRSIALDLKTPADREVLLRLCGDADVVVTNWRPGVAERLGLGDDSFTAVNRTLLRVRVTGYGATGPDAQRPVFDSVIQAKSGLAWAQGTDDAPAFATGYLIDKMTAAIVAQSVLAALYERRATGEGRLIDVAMLDVAAYLGFPDLLANRTFLSDERSPARFGQVSANRPIRARDGWFVQGAVTGAQIVGAVTAVGHPEWADGIFGTHDAAALTTRLTELLESVTSGLSVDECLARFDAHDVPAARCLDADGHLADAQVAHNHLYRIVEHPVLGKVRVVRHPARVAAWGEALAQRHAPSLDEHGDVLRAVVDVSERRDADGSVDSG